MPDSNCPLCRGTGAYLKNGDPIKCDCPLDMRPLTDDDLKRTAELAKRFNWPSE